MAIAASLGVDLLPKRDEAPELVLDAPVGPTIAELAAQIAAPRAGQDTLSASMEVFRLMAAG